MKRSGVLLGLFVFTMAVAGSAVPASAQSYGPSRVDFTASYQLLHIPDETYPAGWNIDVAGPWGNKEVLRWVGEFGMSQDEQTELGVTGTLKFYHAAAGLRVISWDRHTVAPFVQILGGVVHPTANLVLANRGPFSDGDWAPMVQPGGGVSVPLASIVSVVGQVDYRRVFFRETAENEFRINFGIRIGIP